MSIWSPGLANDLGQAVASRSHCRSSGKPRAGRRDRVPTPTETEAILAQASPAFRLIYSALRQCGARPGELCRAIIADVDRANRVITLKEHKTIRKTGQARRIPIGRKLGDLLDQAIGGR